MYVEAWGVTSARGKVIDPAGQALLASWGD